LNQKVSIAVKKKKIILLNDLHVVQISFPN